MAKICENIQLCCGICRICCYTAYKKMCCRAEPLPKEEFSVVCIGLANSGKSTLLASLSGESAEDIEPTVGFSIKALRFDKCILNVKELGGGDNVRPYWKHYWDGTQGVILVVDSSSDEESLNTAKQELSKALVSPSLAELPCFILANCQDKEGAKTQDEIKTHLDLDNVCSGRKWLIHAGSIRDIKKVKEGFEKFNTLLFDEFHEEDEALDLLNDANHPGYWYNRMSNYI